MLVDLLGELQRRVVAQLLVAVVHGRHLDDDGQVPPGLDRDRQGGHVHVQDRGVQVIRPQPVVDRAVLPGLQIDDEVDVGLPLDGGHAVQPAHVHHADAPQLDVVADQLWGGALQPVGRHPLDLHRVVGDEPVAPLDQLDGRLALADARFAQQQGALAIDLHQHAVAGDAGGQIPLQIGDEGAHEFRGGLLGAQHRPVVLFRHLHTLLIGLQPTGDDEGGDVILEQLVKGVPPLLGGASLQVGGLHQADHLEALLPKIVKEPSEL